MKRSFQSGPPDPDQEEVPQREAGPKSVRKPDLAAPVFGNAESGESVPEEEYTAEEND